MSSLHRERAETFDATEYFGEWVESRCALTLSEVGKLHREHLLLHSLSIFLLVAELSLVITLMAGFGAGLWAAFALALFVLTLFSYLFLISYWGGKKREALEKIRKDYLSHVKAALPEDKTPLEHHLGVAGAAFKLTTRLYHLLMRPLRSSQKRPLAALGETLRLMLHHPALFFLQEQLMQASIEEHLAFIRKEPTSIEGHTSLANTYIALAKLYAQPISKGDFPRWRMVFPLFSEGDFEEKVKQARELAVEELRILDDLAPNDPWVHAQLASCYHHLGLEEEEMRTYEHLATLQPKDVQILYRLGVLYFTLARRAKGLKIYQRLVALDPVKAEGLIAEYVSPVAS